MNKAILEMPKGCVQITGEDMLNIDGGYAIPVSKNLTTKSGATAAATKLYNEGKISKSNITLIAKEIRGHAVAYYGAAGLSKLGIAKSTMNELKSHANPIDVENGPDPRGYVVTACNLIWLLP